MMTASGSLEPAPQMADQDSGPPSSFPSGTAKVTMGNAAMTKTMTMTIFDPLDILARTGPCLCHWTVLLPLKSLSPWTRGSCWLNLGLLSAPRCHHPILYTRTFYLLSLSSLFDLQVQPSI